MTAALVWYAAITSVCVAVAAAAAELLLRQFRRQTRWPWVAGLALSLALPLLAPLRQASEQVVAADTSEVDALAALSFNIVPAAPQVPAVAGDLLRLGWLAASAMLTLLVLGVHVRSRRLRVKWPTAMVGGEPVLVSDDDGPAVMGFWRPDIVVPKWLLDRGEAEQRMVVTHEREHLRAGDQFVLGGAAIAVLLMPWNPAVWWMAARLRLAVELDCDARVLGAGTTAHEYETLLIDVAALSAAHRMPALALLHPTSHLQRRLIAMRPNRIRFPRVRATFALAIACVAGVAACNAALPTDADVASLDASKARRAAEMIGGTGERIAYIVDGVIVSQATADKIKAEEIARTRLERLAVDPATGRPVATIEIQTKQASNEREYTDEAKARRLAELEAAGQPAVVRRRAPLVDTARVTEQNNARTQAELDRSLKEFSGILIIDGVIVRNTRLDELPRMNIASVEVIKGEAARLLYGDRAAAGVIKVTTK